MGVLLLLGWVSTGQAQFAVEDVYAGAQATISAVNSGRSLIQEALMIENQAAMIKNQIEELAYAAANLTKSPLQIVNQLSSLVDQYQFLMRQAKGIGFELGTVDAKLGSVYGLFGQPITNAQEALRQLGSLTKEIGNAGETAIKAQAIQEHLADQKALLTTALAESDASAGQLAAVQNTNQMLGIISEQQMTMQAITAASARAQTTMTLAQVAASDRAQELAATSTADWGAMQEVQSVGIPEFK